MGFWDWLPGRGAREAKAPRKTGNVNVFSLNFGPGYDRTPRRGTAEVLRAYGESPWVHTIVDRISSGVAATDWRIYRAETTARAQKLARMKGAHRQREITKLARVEELEELDSHPMLDVLELGCPPWFSGRQVMKLWQTYIELAGEGFGVMNASAKGATELWPIPPHWMTERPQPGTQDSRFVMTAFGSAANQQSIPRELVLWFKHADPFRPWGPGVGRSQSLGDEIDTDEMAAKTAKQAFLNGARPDLLIIPKDQIGEDEAKSFLERWNQKLRGIWNANKVHVLSVPVEVHQFASNFREMQFIELRTWERDMLMQVFGVPPEIFGIIQNSNRSTIDASDYLWASKVIVPRIDDMTSTLQLGMLPLFPESENLVLGYVSPVQEDREFKRSVYAQSAWAFTVDEHRALAGDEPLPDGEGEVFVSPFGLAASESPAGSSALEAPLLEEEPEPDKEAEEEPEEELGEEDEDVEDPEAEKRWKARHTKWPGSDEILRMVTNKPLSEAMVPVLAETVAAFGAGELEKLGLSIAFNTSHPKVQEFLKNRSAEQVQRINLTTRKKLRKVLAEADEQGLGVNELAANIRQVFKAARGPRSLVIAQTETARAGNFGVLEGMQQGGVDEKEWLSTKDEKVRETHEVMDGQRVQIDANFRSPSGAAGPHPGALGSADEDIGCRCTTLAVIKDETIAATEELRVKVWKAHEAQRVSFQKQMVKSLRAAFTEQEQAVLSALGGE